MDKKFRTLIIMFVLIALASIAVTFYRYIIIENISYETSEILFQEALLEQ